MANENNEEASGLPSDVNQRISLSSEDTSKLTGPVEDDKMGGVPPKRESVKSKRVQIAEEKNVTYSDISDIGVYTVEDAIEHMGFGPFQILVTIFAGLIWTADAMEVMLLSVLSPIVTCEWHLQNYEEAMITAVVFVGIFFGGLFWGVVTDIAGRKKMLLIITVWILIFGLASAAAPEYWTLLICRCLAGFGLGGSAQGVTYYIEFLPKKFRGVCIALLEMWWAIGTIFAALLALVVVPNIPDPVVIPVKYYEHLNWRIYVALCAVPMALVLVLFLFVPESARYYLSHGKNDKAEKIIERISRINLRAPPKGRLVSQEVKESLMENVLENETPESLESSFSKEQSAPLLSEERSEYSSDNTESESESEDLFDISRFKKKFRQAGIKSGQALSLLFSGGMWKTSTLLIFIWLGCAWLYYGAILLTTTILESGYDPHCGGVNRSSDNGCQNLTTDFYLRVVWTSAAEFPGMLLTLIIIELIGRKITISAEFIGSALFFGLILICVPEVWITVFLFGARAFATGVFQAVYVYTPEVYPTKIRGIAIGVMTAAARIGGLVTPFVAQALFPINDYVTIGLYGGSAIILAVLTLLLPIETKGRSLKDLKG